MLLGIVHGMLSSICPYLLSPIHPVPFQYMISLSYLTYVKLLSSTICNVRVSIPSLIILYSTVLTSLRQYYFSVPRANRWVHMPGRHRTSLRTFRNHTSLFVIGSLYRNMALTVSFIHYYPNPREAWQSQVDFYVFPNKMRICLCS